MNYLRLLPLLQAERVDQILLFLSSVDDRILIAALILIVVSIVIAIIKKALKLAIILAGLFFKADGIFPMT